MARGKKVIKVLDEVAADTYVPEEISTDTSTSKETATAVVTTSIFEKLFANARAMIRAAERHLPLNERRETEISDVVRDLLDMIMRYYVHFLYRRDHPIKNKNYAMRGTIDFAILKDKLLRCNIEVKRVSVDIQTGLRQCLLQVCSLLLTVIGDSKLSESSRDSRYCLWNCDEHPRMELCTDRWNKRRVLFNRKAGCTSSGDGRWV